MSRAASIRFGIGAAVLALGALLVVTGRGVGSDARTVLGLVLMLPGLIFSVGAIAPRFRAAVGLALLCAGAAVAAGGGIAGIPDWAGWMLLLPGLVHGAAAVPRRILEPLAIVLLIDGGIMTCQPHSILLYGYSIATLLIAATLFTIAAHQPEDRGEPSPRARALRAVALSLLLGGAVGALQPGSTALGWIGLAALAAGTALTVVHAGLPRALTASPASPASPASSSPS